MSNTAQDGIPRARVIAIGSLTHFPDGTVHIDNGWIFEAVAGGHVIPAQQWDYQGRYRHYGYTAEELIEIYVRRSEFVDV